MAGAKIFKHLWQIGSARSREGRSQHVRTAENPADLCSRGASPTQLAESSLWWNGPDWMMLDHNQWAQMKTDNRPENPPEIKPRCMTLASWTDNTEQLDSEQEQNEWRLVQNTFPVGYGYYEFEPESEGHYSTCVRTYKDELRRN